jgi:hypothetical protein
LETTANEVLPDFSPATQAQKRFQALQKPSVKIAALPQVNNILKIMREAIKLTH